MSPFAPAGHALHARTTNRLRAYLVLAALGALAALVFGRPALVAATAPLAVYVALGLGATRRSLSLTVVPVAPPRRAREGEAIEVEVRVTASAAVARAEFELHPGPGLRAAADRGGRPVRVVTALAAGETQALRFPLHAERWGAPPAGTLLGRLGDRFGVLEHELEPLSLPRVGVLPAAPTLQRLIDPRRLRATFGSRVSRGRGEGIEGAEIRAYRPGDAPRRINWRVSARRGELHVSDRHPELSADVVLLFDTFSDVGEGTEGTLVLAVRAATALAAGYVARRDRVGVVGFGGVLTGLGPALGNAQSERIVDVLIASEIAASYADKQVSVIPRRLLPPRALVVALTPLVDGRTVNALFDLRRRGFDLVILEISPERFLPAARSPAEVLAERLWRLRREALRERLRSLGVTVATWDGEAPLELTVLAAAGERRGRGGALRA